jgi:uncharacterized protein YndB with AHSA1/START domain
MPVDPILALTAQRWYPAGPDLVFRALTDAALLERWLCPSLDVVLQVEQLELRVGGRYRFVFHFPEGPRPVIGEYRRIDRPRVLAFTWTWEPPDPHAGIDTLVTIQLAERDGGTELSLVHERFPDVATHQQHHAGWLATLERLERVVVAGLAGASIDESSLRRGNHG